MLGRWAFPSSRKPSAASSGDRASATDNETQAATKRRSRLFRTLRGGFRSHRPKKSAEHVEFPETDALLTQQNPANLTLFNTFEWSGAKRKLSHGGRSNSSFPRGRSASCPVQALCNREADPGKFTSRIRRGLNLARTSTGWSESDERLWLAMKNAIERGVILSKKTRLVASAIEPRWPAHDGTGAGR